MRVAHVRRGREALAGVVRERACARPRRPRGARVGGSGIGGRPDAEQVQRRELVVAFERRAAREQVVEDRADRPDVGAAVDRLAERLLGRHVLDLALEHARRWCRSATRSRAFAMPKSMSFATPLRADEDVLRRDVAVDDAEELARRVRRSSCAACSPPHASARMRRTTPVRDRRRPCARQRAMQLRERVAVDLLHHEVEDVVLLAEVEDLRDVRVLDARRDARLVEEHLLEAQRRSANFGRIVLMATSFSKPCLPRSRATHTLAIPPSAMGQRSSYRSSR